MAYEQILDAGWWPASPLEPQTAATLDTMRQFHVMNLQGKLPPTEYMRALQQLTHGHGILKPVVRILLFILFTMFSLLIGP